MTSALDDAKAFVEEAPPDTRHMKKMLYWDILLTLAMEGPAIGEDLGRLQVLRVLTHLLQPNHPYLLSCINTELAHATKKLLKNSVASSVRFQPILS